MVEGASARLGETDLVGVAVTAVDTMALVVAHASTATAMVSMAPRGSTLIAVEVSTLAVRGTSWLESPAARLEMIGTMVKGSTLMRISELILDSSIEAPKPSVTMYGYAIEQLMFFELPTGGTYKPKVDNVKLVKVTVEGDPMSIPEIAECLRRIVPVENFQWEIYNFQNNVFRVKFPNKSEAQRMKTFRTYPVPDRASDLIFEDWSALEDPLYMLPEVRLRVRGIPADVRTDFLSLWAVGTLFGKTKEVDMIHTRKNKELRLRIGCLDHTLIPETTDVFIQRGFFKLSFEVEPVTVTQLGSDDMGNNGDNNGGGDNNGSNGDKTDGANDMDIEKMMNNEQQGNANSQKVTVKKVNNAKSVVGHQVQHQFEAPILIGSLNTVLLNKEKDREGSPFQADSAPGSVKIRSAAASGLERAGAAGPALPLGSQAIAGQSPVGAASTPGAVSPRTRRPRSPLPLSVT
ncbi:hypothetical protein ACQ4PT_060955 [Festuca glaucescens]